MNIDHAVDRLHRARRVLDHIDTRTKAGKAAVDLLGSLLDSTIRELTEEPPPTLPVPDGARQGISVEPRAEWRRR